MDRQVVEVRHAPIVLERLGARGFDVDAGERNVADLEPLPRGEEGHVGRIAVKRIDEAALLDQQQLQIAASGFNAAREPGRPAAHDQNVQQLLHSRSVPPSQRAVDSEQSAGKRPISAKGMLLLSAYCRLGSRSPLTSALNR